jgi:catechol 2,3-dioxygenase-like lactoylglutathione lyase family enzyme
VTRLRRTTFLTRDAEAMARYYETVFQMRRWYDQRLAVDHRFPPTGLEDGAPARLVVLQAVDPDVGMLGFLQFDHELPTRPASLGPLAIGDLVLVFNTDDLNALCVRAEDAGGTIVVRPAIWSVPDRQGIGTTRLKMLALRDPEGRYAEVSQRL